MLAQFHHGAHLDSPPSPYPKTKKVSRKYFLKNLISSKSVSFYLFSVFRPGGSTRSFRTIFKTRGRVKILYLSDENMGLSDLAQYSADLIALSWSTVTYLPWYLLSGAGHRINMHQRVSLKNNPIQSGPFQSSFQPLN